MWVVEIRGQDRYGRNLPRDVGPFDTREEGESFLAEFMRDGSADFSRLVSPARARSLAEQAPQDARLTKEE